MIPFLDVAASNREVHVALANAFDRVLSSNSLILGSEVESFEQEFAASEGAGSCVGVANGLEALVLSLTAVGIRPGDEVLVPSHTFIATWLAVSRIGATPIPVEPVRDGYTIDLDHAASQLGARTTAIIPVHLYGEPERMDEILEWAGRHRLAVVADAAQAVGATIDGNRLGEIAPLSTVSFYPAKNLGALGDGGAILVNDGALDERLRRLRNYGSSEKYIHTERGFNSRLDELQAAFLRTKLVRLLEWNRRRTEIAAMYSSALAGSGLSLPPEAAGRSSSWHLYVVRSRRRSAFMEGMLQHGIQTQIHYPIPPHKQTAYIDGNYGSLPRAEALAAEVVSLPIGPHMPPSDVEKVISAAKVVAELTEV